MSDGTPIDSLPLLTVKELLSQLRDRTKDLAAAESKFAKDIHRGVALMLIEELESRDL